MTEAKSPIDWTTVDPEISREILRGAEMFLQGTVSVAASADQRASVLAGTFTGAATAVIAGLIALTSQDSSVGVPIYAGGGIAALMFFAGAALCVAAMMPIGFDLPGNEPQNWFDDVRAGRTLSECVGDELSHYQDKIDDNCAAIGRNARRFKWGACVGIFAPLVGAATWGVLNAWC